MGSKFMKHSPLPSNRSFGILFTVVFALIGAYLWWKRLAGQDWLFGASAITLLVTLATPALLAPFNRAWMKLAELLNRIVSPLVLGLIFYGMFMPIAWGMRLAGRDALHRRIDPRLKTYWLERDPPGPDPSGLPNQF